MSKQHLHLGQWDDIKNGLIHCFKELTANWEFVVKNDGLSGSRDEIIAGSGASECAVKKYSTGSPPPDKLLQGNSTQ